MAEWSTRQRLKGLDLVNKIDLLASEAPTVHLENDLHRLCYEIRKRFTHSPELRKKEILMHIRKHNGNGGISIDELIVATGYEKNVLYAVVKELESDAVAERRATMRPAGAGRPGQIRWFLPEVRGTK